MYEKQGRGPRFEGRVKKQAAFYFDDEIQLPMIQISQNRALVSLGPRPAYRGPRE
jgi:hypothetical protein